VSTEASPELEAVDIPAQMMAWQVSKPGEPVDVMALAEVPVPTPGPGQVLIDVWSAGLNFPDALLARGTYQEKPPLPFTPGLELCGEIVAVGEGVQTTRLGERVMGTPALPYGSLAEFAVAEALDVLPAPTGLDDAGASVFHIAYQTGWFGLYRRANLRVGETLLVHAAAGGVGSAAIQIGKVLGARVIAAASSDEKCAFCTSIGADATINYAAGNIREELKKLTGGKGPDVVYDPVGGDLAEPVFRSIAWRGRYLVVGFAQGSIPSLPLNLALLKGASIVGVFWGDFARREPKANAAGLAELARWYGEGKIKPAIDLKLPMKELLAAYARMGSRQVQGKVVMTNP